MMHSAFDPAILLAEKYRSERPGLTLISVEDAAVPVSWIAVDVLAQERKRLPLLDEFVLRSINEGLDSDVEIAQLLGLKVAIIQRTIAEQMGRDLVSRRLTVGGNWKLALTPQGQSTASDLASVSPRSLSLGYAFDRLGWCATAFRRSALIGKDEVRSRGVRKLLGRPGDVSVDDVTSVALNNLLDDRDEEKPRIEIISVKKVVVKARLFLPVALIAFADENGKEVQTAICIDGELSGQHELELNKLGGAEAVGITMNQEFAADRVRRPSSSFATTSLSKVEVLRSAVVRTRVAQFEGRQVDSGWIESAEQAELALSNFQSRPVDRFEYRELLVGSLEKTRRRLVIFSPVIRSATVDGMFVDRLGRLMQSGVSVHIGYGKDRDTRKSDASAIHSLHEIGRKHRDLFRLSQFEEIDEPVLVSDEVLIMSDFHWLSFKGDHDRPYQLPTGFIVRSQEASDNECSRLSALDVSGR
ncbi:hypothetical protein [Antrihabitans sp. YC2-6]|uniref:hypothetical protein n=1 Tax=Antrihabitans sp. YC2-6 TaxID=2799498 RepID=UPI0018F5607A|nr:hypothetical protein [Antrihabitans sp. YC2-6]MBJ8347613.1 hypothetical protein [Antrihabitans sp. YC2-6]